MVFCGMGNQMNGKWAHGENRGGKPYNPPDGWVGFGLNVINKFYAESQLFALHFRLSAYQFPKGWRTVSDFASASSYEA